jgi:hypothetical protein
MRTMPRRTSRRLPVLRRALTAFAHVRLPWTSVMPLTYPAQPWRYASKPQRRFSTPRAMSV